MRGGTPAQTVGPFFHGALQWPDGPYVVPQGSAGAVTLTGIVYDGAGQPVNDALVETWQADPDGAFAHPDAPRVPVRVGFRGFGRCATADDGSYRIITIKPGRVPAADGRFQAPHIDVSLFARGLLHRLVTRIYFPDEADLNAADAVLSSIDAGRRETLVAKAAGDSLRFDIHLQGKHATVFFDL